MATVLKNLRETEGDSQVWQSGGHSSVRAKCYDLIAFMVTENASSKALLIVVYQRKEVIINA